MSSQNLDTNDILKIHPIYSTKTEQVNFFTHNSPEIFRAFSIANLSAPNSYYYSSYDSNTRLNISNVLRINP